MLTGYLAPMQLAITAMPKFLQLPLLNRFC